MALTERSQPQLNFNAVVTRTWRQALRPNVWQGLTLVILLSILVLLPLIRILWTTVADRGLEVWQQVVASDLSPNLFWTPLFNTLMIGVIVGMGCIVIGGFLAWLVILTDMPGRRLIGLLSSLPFMLPNFALALAWETVMRNERVGGDVGLLHNLGVPIPDWLAWGFVPIAILSVAHYYSLAYSLIAAALTSVNADLIEAGEMTGASRVRVLVGILLPVVMPAMVAAGLLTFAAAVSAFAVPALLGLPVRFYTLSTRLYGMISTGQVERGYVLAVLLIVVAAGLLWVGNRMISGRRAFTTITGKGGRRKRLALGAWRAPMFVLALFICLVTTIFPGLILLASSFAVKSDSLTSGFTAHYWIGESSMEIAQGQAGILRNPQVLDALINTLIMSGSVAFAATLFGFAIGFVITQNKTSRLSTLIAQLSYLPILIPGIAFGAAYVAQFGQPIGPFPALYGTLAILILAGTAHTLPYASQSGRAAFAQVSAEIDEAAKMVGAPLWRRLGEIFFPLTARGLFAGTVLVFVRTARDLSIVVLLFTPTSLLLSVVAFRYASEGFRQFSNAITVIILAISVGATLLAQRMQGRTQSHNEND